MTDENTLTGSEAETQTGTEAVTEKTAEVEKTESPETEAKDTKAADSEKPDKASEDQSNDEPKPQRKGAKERIAELTAKVYAAKRSEQDAQRRIKFLEERLREFDKPPPKESDFPSYEEFQAAQTAYHVRQATKQDREIDISAAQETAKQATQEAATALQEAFMERAAEFAERVPDYHQKVADPSLPISPEMASEIHASEKGPEIAYFLASHRAEAARIAALTDPREVARAIGRIEGRLSTPPPKKVTQAPAPVKAIATGSGSKQGFDPASASIDDMREHLKRTGVL